MGIWRSLHPFDESDRKRGLRRRGGKRRPRSAPRDRAFRAARELGLERFEDRLLLAGPQLISIIPNDGDVLLDGQTLNIAPNQLTFRFDQNQVIDPATLGGIAITRSGGDGLFGAGFGTPANPLADVSITPGFRGIGARPNEVVVRFAEALPDDIYRITIVDAGPRALANTEVPAETYINSGPTRTPLVFRLDLGPQVVAVVPQPITRDPVLGLVQAQNQIEVYLNGDDLAPADTTLNPAFFQLIRTNNTADTNDDLISTPTRVDYFPGQDKAVLTFGANLQDLPGKGAFRLRIGTDEAPLPNPTRVNVGLDFFEDTPGTPGSTFATAFDAGFSAVTQGPQSRILASAINSQAIHPGLVFPGGQNEPGHRDIPHFPSEDHLNGGPDSIAGVIATRTYNFPDIYGSVPGNPELHNVITPEQRERTREIFQLYGYYYGVQFVEAESDLLGAADFAVITGEVQAADPTLPANLPGVADGFRAIMNANIFQTESAYGGGWFTTAMHEIGHLLGLGHAYDRPPITVQGSSGGADHHPNLAAGTTPEPIFPGDEDILHGQFLHRRDSKDIDLYRFVVTTTGSFTAETIAERQTPTSLLDSVLTLYDEVNVVRLPKTGASPVGSSVVDGHRFTINDGIVPPITFEFDNNNSLVDPNAVRIVFNPATSTAHDIAVAVTKAVNDNNNIADPDDPPVHPNPPGLTVRADVEFDRVVLRGPITVTPAGAAGSVSYLIERNIVSRNDDYFSQDSFIQLQLDPGRYFIAVTSTGNTAFDPHVPDSGFGGNTQGSYELRLDFNPRPQTANSLTDFVAAAGTGLNLLEADTPTPLDGDADGRPGGIFNFWFNTGNTIFVDKLYSTAIGPSDGSLAAPYSEVDQALAVAANRLVAPTADPLDAGRFRVVDGESFVVDDGINPPVTFEFNSAGGVAAGRVSVPFAAGDSAQTIAQSLVTAINGVPQLNTLATLNAFDSTVVDLAANKLVDVQQSPSLLNAAKIVRILGTAGADNTLGVRLTPGIADGQSFRISSGTNSVLFEFDNDNSVVETTTRRQVAFSASSTAAEMAAAMAAAINGSILSSAASNSLRASVTTLAGQVRVDLTALGAIVIDALSAPTLLTGSNASAYLVGFDQFGNELPDGSEMKVPQAVTVMVDAGAVFKLQQANLDVGLSSPGVDRSRAALQVLGTPGRTVVFTSFRDNAFGQITDSPDQLPGRGNWGGLVFREEAGLGNEAIFLNFVGQSQVRYGGGQVNVDGVTSVYNPIHMESRPTILYNTITNSADAAMSAGPNTFEESHFGGSAFGATPFGADYDRVGPHIRGNRLSVVQPGALVITVPDGSLLADGQTFIVNDVRFEFDDTTGTTPGVAAGNVAVLFTPTTPDFFLAFRMAFAINGVAGLGVQAAVSGNQVSLTNVLHVNLSAPLRLREPLFTNTVNGLFVRTRSLPGEEPEHVTVAARFDDTDIVHVISDNLFIQGTPGGPALPVGGQFTARLDASLVIDPGVVVKLTAARIEAELGGTLIAEGRPGHQVVFTSLHDGRFGAGGTFDTNGDDQADNRQPAPGDWGGLFFRQTSRGSIDHALVTYAGGSTPIEGGFDRFNPIEIRQADVRIANSSFVSNDDGAATGNRAHRGVNTPATIFVLGAQPVIVNNVFRDNRGAVIDINANALSAAPRSDSGRSRGPAEVFGSLQDNRGPLVRLNRIGNDPANTAVNGMLVRGGTLTTQSIWDDTDIVHVLLNEIAVPNFHTFGGLRLQSSPTESLVVKLQGPDAGFTASGLPLDINDRIGGTLQVLGQPGHPVVLTSLGDQTAGAGLTPDGGPQNDTANVGPGGQPTTGTSGPVFIDGGDRDDFGHGDFDGTNNTDGWKFIEQAVNFTYTNSRNIGVTEILVIGTTTGTRAADAIESAASVLGLPAPVYATGAAISTENFANYRIIYVPSDESNTSGGISDADMDLLTLRKTDIQDYVNITGGGLVALTEGGAATPYSWLELPDPFTVVVYGANSDELAQTPLLAAAGFNISDAELNAGTPWHNSFSGPPGFNGLQVWVVSVVTGEVVTLGLPAGSAGIGVRPTEWRSLRLDRYSNDRNVAVIQEAEKPYTGGLDANRTPGTAQPLGRLAPDEKSGDDVLRLGFEIHGTISYDDPADVDVYSFQAKGGTEVWLDIDRTAHALDTVLELVDASGTVLARSNNSVDEAANPALFTGAGMPPGNIARVMQRDVLLGDVYSFATFSQPGQRDYYTTNPRDAGMRLVLPGPAGTNPNTYYVRVRSFSSNAAINQLSAGTSRGAYQLQVRLRELDEIPGSTVAFSDIRFATNGIEVLGLPAHSPLAGEAGETRGPNDTFDASQDLGNLLTSDRNSISVPGALSALNDVDWYRFTLDYDQIQANAAFTNGERTFPVVFDIDYADGIGRADTVISVFDDQGRLILVSRDSHVNDDQPAPNAGNNLDDLGRSTVGLLDPFIFNHLPEGDGRTYFVAVHSNARLPTVLNATFEVGAAQSLVRLEPVTGVTRIAEDHISFQDRQTARPPGDPTVSLFTRVAGDTFGNEGRDSSNVLSLNAHATPFTLSDVTLYVITPGQNGRLFTVDPFTGVLETFVGQFNDHRGPDGQAIDGYADITFRNDGRLFGLTVGTVSVNATDDSIGNFNEISTADGSILSSSDDEIITYEIDPANPISAPDIRDAFSAGDNLGDGIHFQALAFLENGTDRRLFAVGKDFGGFGVLPRDNQLYELDPDTGAALTPIGRPILPTDARPKELSSDLRFRVSNATDLPFILSDGTTVDNDIDDPGDLFDGQFFVLSSLGQPDVFFEYDSGPEIRFGSKENPLENAFKFRDGMFFMLDGVQFELDSGPVITVPGDNIPIPLGGNPAGNLINDGDFFSLRDTTIVPPTGFINAPVTFEFDSNNSLNDPGAVRIGFVQNFAGGNPIPTTRDALASTIINAINGVGGGLTVQAEFTELGRITLTDDFDLTPISLNQQPEIIVVPATDTTAPFTTPGDISDLDTFQLKRWITATLSTPTTLQATTFQFDSGPEISFGAQTNANAFRDEQFFWLNDQQFEFNSGPVLVALGGGGSGVNDGDTFTITDTSSNSLTFEFDSDATLNVVTNVAIPFNLGDSAAAVATSMATAITNSALTTVATVTVAARITLVNDSFVSVVSAFTGAPYDLREGDYTVTVGATAIPFEETDTLNPAAAGSLQSKIKTVVDGFTFNQQVSRITTSFARNRMAFLGTSGVNSAHNFAFDFDGFDGNGGPTVPLGLGLTAPVTEIAGTFNGSLGANVRVPFQLQLTDQQMAQAIELAIDNIPASSGIPGNSASVRTVVNPPNPVQFRVTIRNTTEIDLSGTPALPPLVTTTPLEWTLSEGYYGFDPANPSGTKELVPFEEVFNLLPVNVPPQAGDPPPQELQSSIATAVNTFFNGRITASFARERMAFVGDSATITNFAFDFDGIGGNGGAVTTRPLPSDPTIPQVVEVAQPTSGLPTQNSVVPGRVRIPFRMNDNARTIALATEAAIDTNFSPNNSARVFQVFNARTFPTFDQEIEVLNTTGSDMANVSPPFVILGGGPGGIITGLAQVDSDRDGTPDADTLYAITDRGGLYVLRVGGGRQNPNAATLTYVQPSAPDLLGIRFTGLTHGPRSTPRDDVPRAYSDLLFATAADGRLYAFNTLGQLQPVFDSNGDGLADSSSIALAVQGVVGLAFSTLDYNMWHVTNRRGTDPGHGIELPIDQSRNRYTDGELAGGTSFYFGLEDPRVPATISIADQPGAANYTTNDVLYNTYDLPGGAYGSLRTNAFSLADYTYQDKPTLYFNYYLDTQRDQSDDAASAAMFDSARVLISADNGVTWTMLASNNSNRSGDFELPAIPTASSRVGYTGGLGQRVQELFDDENAIDGIGWRQARIDLGDFVGLSHLVLRFDFSTAGDITDPSSPKNYRPSAAGDVPGDEFGGFNAGFPDLHARHKNNRFEGFYVDDIVVGLAGRGEVVTTSTADTTFFPVPRNTAAGAPTELLTGPYQLEIRRGTEYGQNVDRPTPDTLLFNVFDMNDRLTSGFTLVAGVSTSITAAPTGPAAPLTFNFVNLPPSGGGAQGILRLSVTGDLDAPNEFLNVTLSALNAPPFSTTRNGLFASTGQSQQAVEAAIVLTAAELRALTAGGAFGVTVAPSAAVFNVTNISLTLEYAAVNDGDQFVISDGLKTVTFEFDNNGSVVQSSTLRRVAFNSSDTPTSLATKIRDSINAARSLGFLAVSAATVVNGSATTGRRVDLVGAGAVNPVTAPGTGTPAVGVLQFENRGDRNTVRDQGQIILQSNRITNALDFSIVVDSTPRDAGGSLPHPGVPRNLSTLNTARLVPGVTITNNVLVNGGQGGILFSGDPNNGNDPLAAVPFGRILNNTIVGKLGTAGTATGVGIRVNENASPTILNNIFANLARGIDIDGSSSSTVVGGSLYQFIDPGQEKVGGGSETFRFVLADTDPLFRDLPAGNLYLAQGSLAIDSSVNRLDERTEMTAAKSLTGIGISPILAPDRDLLGQLRVDDPNSDPLGVGASVFRDRGALERADFSGPTAVLLVPRDNDPSDQDPAVNTVHLLGSALAEFAVHLVDFVGAGVDDDTVNVTTFTLRRNGILLTPDVDYVFRYDNNNNVVRLIAAAGIWLNGNQFTIAIDNGVKFDPLDSINFPPVGIRDLAGNLLQANGPDGFTVFNVILDSVQNDAPVINIPGTQSVNEDDPAGLTLSRANNNLITLFDVDAGDSAIQVTLTTAAAHQLTLGPNTPPALTVNGNGTSTVVMTGRLADINAALDGLRFNPGLNFNGPATIAIAANDQGNFPPPAEVGIATVNINVIAVNDAPAIAAPATVQSVLEDNQLTFSSAGGNLISVNDLDITAAEPVEVTLTAGNGRLTLAGTSPFAGLTFTAGDGTADATMTFRGSLAVINTALDGLAYDPNLNFNGSTTIQIGIDDLGNIGLGVPLLASATVNIDVVAVNDDPVNVFPETNGIPDVQTTDQNTPLVFSSANGNALSIIDVDAGGNPVEVTLTATDGTLTLGGMSGLAFTAGDGADDATMTFTGTVADINAALQGLTFTPTQQFFGVATLTIITNDQGHTGLGGAKSDSDTIQIGVGQLPNDPPVVTAPTSVLSMDEDTSLVFTAAGGIGISVFDPDVDEGGIGDLQLTLTATNGVSALGSTSGLIVSGNGTGVIVATGPMIQLNQALEGLAFTSDPDFAGPATITIVANDLGNTGFGGPLDSAPAIINIAVQPIQDAPVLDNSGSPSFASILEDVSVNNNTGSQVSVMLATGAGGDPITDPDAGALEGIAVVALSGTSNGTWQYSLNGGSTWSAFTAVAASNARLLRPGDRVRFLPGANFFGTVTLTFHAWDQTSGTPGGTANLTASGATGGGTAFSTASETASLDVLPVNDAPSFSVPASLAVDEDSPLTTVASFAFAISMGPSNEAGQAPLAFLISNNNESLFEVLPTISTNGTLRFKPAPDAFGLATLRIRLQDTGGTANGGVDTSVERLTTITVNGINDAPTLNSIAPITLPQNAGQQTVVLSGITAGPNEAQGLSVAAVSSNTSLIPDPTVTYFSPDSSGTLTFTPVTDAFGTATIAVTVTDDGGTAKGGINSLTRTFLVTVQVSNDPPVAISDTVTTDEDTDAAITLGGTDTENDPLTAIITSLPTGGRLFQTADGVTRGAQITAVDTAVSDSLRRVIYAPNANQNGTPHDSFRFVISDGQPSAEATITVNVTSVNDRPTTSGIANVSVNSDSPPVVINLFDAFADIEDSDAELSYLVVANTNIALFRSVTISSSNPKRLTLDFAPGASGTANITVRAIDRGGLSVSTVFTVRVNAVPVAADDRYVLSLSTTSSAIVAEGVLANDSDGDNGPNPLVATIVNGPTRGSLVLGANGSFTYAKGPAFQGIDRFTYQVSDGQATSRVATVTLLSHEATLVTKLYQQVLARDPEESGLQFWAGRLANGEPVSIIAQGIFESDERLNPIIRQFYLDFLLREPDAAGVAFWRDQVWKRDGGPENVIAGIAGSPEFFQSAGGTNRGFVMEMYRRVLTREPEPTGLAFWENALNENRLTRSQVVLGFLTSDENFRLLISGWFQQYLARIPQPAELNPLVDRMRGGASHREIQITLIDSDEYRNSPPPPAFGTVRVFPL